MEEDELVMMRRVRFARNAARQHAKALCPSFDDIFSAQTMMPFAVSAVY